MNISNNNFDEKPVQSMINKASSNNFKHPPRSTTSINNYIYNHDSSLSNRATYNIHNSNVTCGRYINDSNSFLGNFNKKEMSNVNTPVIQLHR